ncbi:MULTISPECIES: HNH endonuclease [Streptomyces]|uniref:HNH endonuclease n=1 Tax=Streptomyces TaxID=1883 RepID=UPI0004BDD804|nr:MULTISPECIES: HNH endonuclease [Streptomyces]KOU09821.1 HNH endonuclease [Streptomyces sp. WM6349]KOU77209.1 HNH endonuclease [Streptomyces sp. XY593]KOV16349.1 HNH endonuclease [Streptomyces sp. XY511]KOV43854.1 HNH endonuclease [Streptomyces sp. H036]MCI4081727.1 HNH endonuclease [Streptomyces sp. MMS21 TC-5]
MPISPYTKERLAEAAEGARTLTEALRKLGVDPNGPSRRYLHDRMRRLGVDVSHFEREGARWTREVLAEAVAASTNMCEVLRRLGLDVVGGHHTHISRRVKAFGIDTSHFALPSSAGRPKVRRTPEAVLVRQDGPQARRMQSAHLKRALKALGIPEECRLCGIEAVWQGRPLPLEVDHIDGDWRNNQPENLRLLCPNCHSTTDTYRGRAKGRRR